MTRKTPGIATIAVMSLSVGAAGQPPPPPELLLSMTLRNETRLPLTQNSITTPNVDLQLYGDGRNIVVAVGGGANLPRTFFGLCEKPCGFT